MIRRESINTIHHFDDLWDKTIGVISGTSGESHARRMAPQTSKFCYFVDERTMLSALYQGKIDAIARGTIGNCYQAYKDTAVVVTGVCENSFEDIAFVTAKLDLAVTLNAFLDQLKDSGELSRLHWQWFSTELNVGND